MADKPYDNGFSFNKPVRKSPGRIKFEAFEWHRNAGSMGEFRTLYPLSQPKIDRMTKKQERLAARSARQRSLAAARAQEHAAGARNR